MMLNTYPTLVPTGLFSAHLLSRRLAPANPRRTRNVRLKPPPHVPWPAHLAPPDAALINKVMEVGAGVRAPPADFLASLRRYSSGQLAVLLIFYVELWAIKMNFLIFFRKLGGQVVYYRSTMIELPWAG